MRYTKPEAGEWVQPKRRGYKLACCDCGLVHTMDFRVCQGKPQFRAFRNERSTGQMRRHMVDKGEMPTAGVRVRVRRRKESAAGPADRAGR